MRIAIAILLLGLTSAPAFAQAPPVAGCALMGDVKYEDVTSLCPDGTKYVHRYRLYGAWTAPEPVSSTSGTCRWLSAERKWDCGSRRGECKTLCSIVK